MGNHPNNWVKANVIERLRDLGHDIRSAGNGCYNQVSFDDWKDWTTNFKYRVFENDMIPELIETERATTFQLRGQA